MSTGAIIGIIVAVIVVVAIIALAMAQARRARIRRQFGPEYDRLARDLGSQRKAEAELTARQRRVEALGIHQLSPEQQASYSGDWTAVQERFVDTPAEAVSAADTLIWSVMRDRGYPADDRNASEEALSVYHAQALDGYRQAHAVRADQASTEQLRETMIRYRLMFTELTGLREGDTPERDRVAEIRGRTAVPADAATPPTTDPAAGTTTDPVTGTDPAMGTDPATGAPVRAADEMPPANGEIIAENSDRTADTPR